MRTLQENGVGFEQTQIASVIKRLGNPVSTILLDSPCHVFTLPKIDGLIGYQLVRHCAIVMGDPVCASQDLAELTEGFHRYCEECNWTIMYLLSSGQFAQWAMSNNRCKTSIQVGEELILDPTQFQLRQKLRWKVNHAKQFGVEVKECLSLDLALKEKMEIMIQTWLSGKHGPQIHLGSLASFEIHPNKRIFYAFQAGKVIGLLALSRIDQFQGWVVSSFLALADAPVGTTEDLLSSTVAVLAEENCQFLCLGAVAGPKMGKIVGLSRFWKFCAHAIFGCARWLFHFDRRKIYFDKFHPHLQHTYVLCNGRLTIKDLLALKDIIKH